jgi:hypothetical protein
LVLFIPYSQGCILLADRQDTYGDGSKAEILKLFLLRENGPAIGCSGPSTIIRKFYSDLAESKLMPDEGICEQATKILEKIFIDIQRNARYSQNGLRAGDLALDALIMESHEGKITLSKLESLLPYRLDPSKIVAIPRIPDAERYLNIDTSDFSEKKAIFLGEEILRQVSFSNYTIGPPEYHGYDMIKITNAAAFSVDSVGRTLVKRDASELSDYVNQTVDGEE